MVAIHVIIYMNQAEKQPHTDLTKYPFPIPCVRNYTSNTKSVKPADVQEPPTLEATKHPNINDASAVPPSSIKLQVPEPAKANKREINDVRKKLNIEWLFHSRVNVKKLW